MSKKDFAVAVAVSRKPKKYAKGGQIPSVKEESLPGTQEERNDKKDIEMNSKSSPMPPRPSRVPLKHPSMVKSDAFSVKLRDQEDHLEAKMPPKNETEHIQYDDEHALHSKKFAAGGKVEEDADHQDDIHNQKVEDEYGDGAEQDEQGSPEGLESDDDMESPAKSKFMSGKMMAEGGPVDDEEEMEHDASIAGAIMRRKKMAEGGAVDLSLNADEEPNHEDDESSEALSKENYNESEGLEHLDQPKDSNERGHVISDEDAHDLVGKIRKLMSKRSPITK